LLTISSPNGRWVQAGDGLGGIIAQYLGYRAAFLILGSFAIGSLILWLAFASTLKPACADDTVPVPQAA
jgi:predicted MFS family arabinose efflux permease